MRDFHLRRIIPPSFKVLIKAPTSGSQTVARAELEAVAIALETFPTCRIFSDSQYTVDLCQRLLTGCQTPSWRNAPNSDLIARLRACVNRDLHTVLKIKAHQEIQSTMPDQVAYDLLGNQIADTAAKQAVHSHSHDLNSISTQIAATQAACRSRIRALHDFMWDVRTKQWELLQDTAEVRFRPFRGPEAHALVDWAVAESLPAPDALPDSRLEMFVYGTAFGLSLYRWACALKWPTQKISTGITFLELLINFLLTSGIEYPRLVGKTSAGGSLYQNSQQNPAVKAIPWDWIAQTQGFADSPQLHKPHGALDTLFIRGRHLQISTWVSSQKLRLISAAVRVNQQFLCCWRLRNQHELDAVIEELSALLPKDKLHRIYEQDSGPLQLPLRLLPQAKE